MFGVVCAVSLLGLDWSRFGRPGIDYVAGELLVTVKPSASLFGASLLRSYGRVEDLGEGTFRVTVSDAQPTSRAYARLRGDASVAAVEPNFLARSTFLPNDPALSSQYGIRLTRTDLAWDYEQGADWTVVAIVDTGVDRNHPEFENRVLPGYDFVNNDADPLDDNGHGTLCAGIVGAAADNGAGIAGIAFGCRILPVKVLKKDATGSYSTIAKGIRWAADQGVEVINLSLAGSSYSAALESAVRYALNKRVVVVAAAGNDGRKDRKVYPAAFNGVISVAALDRRGLRIDMSNYGKWIDLAAPGGGIYSTYPNRSYRTASGTSMATAFVSGQAALLKSYFGSHTPPSTIRVRLRQFAKPVGDWVSAGMVDALRAIRGDTP